MSNMETWQINHDDKGHYLIGPELGNNVGMAFNPSAALLFAAAPAMLAALEAVLSDAMALHIELIPGDVHSGIEPASFHKARAAIAQAKEFKR